MSRYGNPAFSGVSLISQRSRTAHANKIAAGMKNTAQVASIVWPSGKKMRRTSCAIPLIGPGAFRFVMSMIACPQSNAK